MTRRGEPEETRWWERLEALKMALAKAYLTQAFDRSAQLTLQIDELEREGARRGWTVPTVNGRRPAAPD